MDQLKGNQQKTKRNDQKEERKKKEREEQTRKIKISIFNNNTRQEYPMTKKMTYYGRRYNKEMTSKEPRRSTNFTRMTQEIQQSI